MSEPPKISDDEMAKISKRLDELKMFPCPRCGTDDWIISNRYANLLALQSTSGMACIVTVCKNCGYLSLHLKEQILPGME